MQGTLSRRGFLGVAGSAVVAGAVLTACGAKTGSETTESGLRIVTTQLFWTHSTAYAGWYIAAKKGFFAGNGIESRLLAGGPNVTSIESVVLGGQANVGVSTLMAVAQAVGKGADLVAFAAQQQESPGGIISLATKPIRQPADLVGKTLALNASARVTVDAILAKNGLPKDYKMITSTGDVEQLTSGACDGMTGLMTAQLITLQQRAVDSVGVTFSDLGFPAYGNVLVTTRKMLEDDQDTLVRYFKSVRSGWEGEVSDPAAAAALTVDTYGQANGLNLATSKLEAAAETKLMTGAATVSKGLGAMSPADVERQFAVMRTAGISGLGDMSRVFSTQVIDAARPPSPR